MQVARVGDFRSLFLLFGFSKGTSKEKGQRLLLVKPVSGFGV